MKNWKHFTVFGFFAVLALAFAFTACDNGNGDETIVCICPEGSAREPDEYCCQGVDCECPIAEPAVRDFTLKLDLEFSNDGSILNNVIVKDTRTQAGSITLKVLGIVEKLENYIMGAFNMGTGPLGAANRGRFRAVFGVITGPGIVTISVDNFATYYEGLDTPDRYTINIHIDYLQNNLADVLQSEIYDAVMVMSGMPHAISY